ncbi:MAG: glutamate--tRNA ligase [Planctomycetaceae bacterium]|nr:MAG: glutamate--tRNA ligase [Planctomycetaceae bacterium]
MGFLLSSDRASTVVLCSQFRSLAASRMMPMPDTLSIGRIMIVRTRFAPSPTGYMHLGGMRTALFAWLWARHHQGTFILRIDDTDQQRNIEQALAPIFRAFTWLGLDWDEGPQVGGPHAPYFQSQRTAIYQQALERLLCSGQAYRDFDTPEQVALDRQAAEQAGRPYLGSRRSLELSSQQIADYLAEGRPHVVRLLVPRDQQVQIVDHVRGGVVWDAALIPDPVLQRSDGSFLYNFATVVDDAMMHITHVIRAEEHLSNTPVQVLIYRALGHTPPEFAHIPFITAPGSKKKLSKRDVDKLRQSPQLRKLFERGEQILPRLSHAADVSLNPVMLEYYERLGYLPEAMLNTLVRLGWSYDDKTEIFSLPEMIEKFTLDRVVKSPAAFDPEKLQSYQAHWMSLRSVENKVDQVWPYCAQQGWHCPAWQGEEVRLIPAHDPQHLSSEQREFLRRLVLAIGDRLKVFSDILDYPEFLAPEHALIYDPEAVKKRWMVPEAATVLQHCRRVLETVHPFTPAVLEQALHQRAEQEGWKMSQVVHPLRLAITGRSVGIGLFEALMLVGRARCLARLDRALAYIAEHSSTSVS